MSVLPVSRETMRALKAQNDEEIKQRKIDFIITRVYMLAVRCAETETSSVYRYTLATSPLGNITLPTTATQHAYGIHATHHTISSEFAVENMEEILRRLCMLFPECVVEYKNTSLARGRDGKEYDISTLDDKIRPFIDIRNSWVSSCIVIDWS
jgi:hypothetical protein